MRNVRNERYAYVWHVVVVVGGGGGGGCGRGVVWVYSLKQVKVFTVAKPWRKMAQQSINTGDSDYLLWVCAVCQLPFWGSPD